MKKEPFDYEAFKEKLKGLENPPLQGPMEGYMRHKFPFLGVKAPERRELISNFFKEYHIPNKDDWKGTIEKFWTENEREFQLTGMEIAFRCKKYFEKGDHDFFATLITSKSWWDTVDYIASNLVGTYLKKTTPEQLAKITGEWNRSENIWLVRTSIIFQLKYKDETRFDLMRAYILNHRESKEFFIQKAMGWALRQYSKFSPEEVTKFVSENKLPALTQREALKHLNRKVT